MLPKIVYVYECGKPGTDDYALVVSTDSHEQMEGVIGVYKLSEKLHVRHKPQFRREKSKHWFDK